MSGLKPLGHWPEHPDIVLGGGSIPHRNDSIWESDEIASDKYRLLKLVLELGVSIQKIVFVRDKNAKDAVNRLTGYHVVVKPGRSLLKADQRWMKTSVHIVRNEKELTEMQSNNLES